MKTKNIFIVDKQQLNEKIKKFKQDGISKIHIVSDFDRTLTRFEVNGEKVNSVISILRDENYLTPDYSDRAKALFNKYHSFEIDFTIPWEERKAKMLEWWSTHYDVLKECGLTKSDLESIVNSNRILFRNGYDEFFKLSGDNNIPITIITANGLGGDIIKLVLKRFNVKSDDINLVANEIIWDEKGKFIDIKKPIIHVLNKDEVIIKDEKIHNSIKDRNNVILLGDTEGDIGMVEHIKYDSIIKVGYLNEKETELMEKYCEIFDIVIINDGGLEVVNKILKQIITK